MSDDRHERARATVTTSAAAARKTVTFPPARWEDDVLAPTPPAASDAPGGDASAPATQPPPPTEREARAFLDQRFRAAGYQLASDYTLHSPGLAAVLDGFDPARHTGYVYLSHDDADVVSDIDAAEELAFKHMFESGEAYILVLHDRDIDALSTLEHRLDEFLAEVHRRTT